MLKWIHVFGEMNMHIWLCKDMGTMNRPLRLTECSQPISWVNATHSRGVSWVFRGVFVDFSPCVRCIIAIRATHYYNMCNAK